MTPTTTTNNWEACKAVLRSAMERGYQFWPVPHTVAVGVREDYRVTVHSPAGQQLGVGQGASYAEACRAALALVERDQERRAAA